MSSIYERRARSSRLCSRGLVILFLRFFWIVAIVWCEFGVFFYSLSGCRWPDRSLTQLGSSDAAHGSSANANANANVNVKPTRVLLVSDPQLRFKRGGGLLASWLAPDPATSYVRKAWHAATRLRPHAVIFLGDMLHSGRYIKDKNDYEDYYKRFNDTFSVDPSVPVYYLPGNSDIGLGDSPLFSVHAHDYFKKYFGPLNQVVTIAGHKFVMLDASGLVDEDYRRHTIEKTYDEWMSSPDGTVSFVKSVAEESTSEPIILLSHIPLSRPSSKSCGQLREKGRILAGAGRGYQKLLGKQTTEFLLGSLRPLAVFSGDDHDYCEVTHMLRRKDGGLTPETIIPEITVKSFSPSKFIRRPGFELLSLIPPTPSSSLSSSDADARSFAYDQCLLPDTQRIWHTIYIPCGVLTALLLVYVNTTRSRHHRRVSSLAPISLSPQGSPPPRHQQHQQQQQRPESAIWSTFSPARPSPGMGPVSPTSPLPPSLRVPSGKGGAPGTFHASSSTPGGPTPRDSPLLSPIAIFSDEDDREDALTPAHYLAPYPYARPAAGAGNGSGHGSGHGHGNGNGLLNGHGHGARMGGYFEEEEAPPRRARSDSLFGSGRGAQKGWSWSWSFVLGGRRRRMTIKVPAVVLRVVWPLHRQLMVGESGALGRKRRGLLRRLAGDVLSVAWPAVAAWSVVGWLFF
ncbi:Metallo-dependent phosphatase [Coniophora puteana RWD-64-598 SS2]|uniref:Metallo-dependent phosphatase n=1 Tax=Coniophora puteana (strain RWD-64-598) TaxID=741705 RepID=A0A5M3MUK4_CONPW|nr:Metallo-dependent phosphatase [Coniophora puteana RWD-64-598 SS2]EIW82858.1 Metallo-dependent phosphatase [Coniophora puteana RWD-64-598 SS2]